MAAVAVLLVAFFGVGCSDEPAKPEASAEGPPEVAVTKKASLPVVYVGSGTCAGCHPAESEAWTGSHHDLAMQPATSATALAPFAGEGHVSPSGVKTSFHTNADSTLRVRIERGAEAPEDLPVAYLFGASPLQQVLIDRGKGRLAALHVAWDSRRAEKGGQRWFSLHGAEEVPETDPLHWTGPAGNWNQQCADCHSTGLETPYDLKTDEYAPRWTEMDVACEACHGPGSTHVDQAQAGLPLDPSSLTARPLERTWSRKGDQPIATRDPALPRASAENDAVCAPCHSRRSRIAKAAVGAPFLDGHAPTLLEPGLYHLDGQIRDEVYVWGSFAQSKMFEAGVVCSDCHDPHRLVIEEPDAVCAGCHEPAVFAATTHHQHPTESAGASCTACHMATTTYMQVDPRHDHSFRVPRPDLSERFGVPNACASCHESEEPGWSAQEARKWWGEPAPHWIEEFDPALRAQDPSLPPIVRATAVSQLVGRSDRGAFEAVGQAAKAKEAIERFAAARAASTLPPQARWGIAGPLLSDSRRAVRTEAARALAGLAPAAPGPNQRRALQLAVSEFRDAQTLALDRPSSHVRLGDLERAQRNLPAAETAYREALRLGPWFVPAAVNLADLLRELGRDEDGMGVLRATLRSVGAETAESAPLHQSLGLLLVRQGRHEDALAELEQYAALEPENPHAALLYGLTLEAVGREEEAAPFLKQGGAGQGARRAR